MTGKEINLLKKYPRTFRDIKKRLEEKTENLVKEVSARYDYRIKRKNINVLNTLNDINNPAKTAIIFREILDKPRSLRRKIR